MSKRILSEIWIYPVKSLGGIRLAAAEVDAKGLRDDRRWMLTDEEGKFLTQRVHPRMALFKVHQTNGQYVISYGQDKLSLPPAPGTGAQRDARIWNDTVSVVEAGPVYHTWFSERLGIRCRLVAFPEENPRLIDPAYRLANESVSLADGYPILIIGQASLDDLNGRLETRVPMNRFRPNFVFTGGAPYEEDTWRNFRVGNGSFVGVKPCARCVLTTVDQERGVAGKEPLLTLSRYRKKGDKIYFGQNVIPVGFKTIYEGDEISVA